MKKTTTGIALTILINLVLLSASCTQAPPASAPPPCNPPTAVSLPAFPDSWDGVHQFVVGDSGVPMPNPTNVVPPWISDLLRPDAATVDFVWGGDSYANCWAGDASCINLPANSQHPVVGHYIPFGGIAMLANYARCLDQSDCNLVSSNYDCKPRPQSDTAAGPFKPRVTFYLNTYTDAAGNPEKVCQPKSPGLPFVTALQARRIEISYWRRAHPGWLLYSAKNDTAVYTPDIPDKPGAPHVNEEKETDSVAWISGSLPMDVSNPEVAREVLGRIARWPNLDGRSPRAKGYYGAISLDTVQLATGYTAIYRCKKGGDQGGCTQDSDWEPLDPGPIPLAHGYGKQCPDGGYCYPAWTTLVLNWVTTVRDTAHTLGLNLVINVSYGGDKSSYPFAYIPPDDPKLRQLFDTVDGVFDEGGFTSGQLQESPNDGCVPIWNFNGDFTCGINSASQNRWSNFSSYLLAVQSRGKPYFSKNASPGPGNLLVRPSPEPPPDPKATPWQPEPQPQAQAIPWVLASFLMSRGTSPLFARQAIYMSENTPGKGDNLGLVPYGGALYKALNPPIGHPCSEFPSQQGNVFTRQFSGGLVVLNANGPGGPAATISLPTLENVTWPATAPTSLAAESGAVILVTSGRLCEEKQ